MENLSVYVCKPVGLNSIGITGSTAPNNDHRKPLDIAKSSHGMSQISK